MKFLAVALAVALLTSTAFAKDKYQDTGYQDAVLVSFHDVVNGSNCSQTASTRGTVDAHTNEDGDTDGTLTATTRGNSECTNRTVRRYTLQVADHTYVVEPGYVFLNRSEFLLIHALPGAHLRVRFDKKGLFIKLNQKESRFDIVEAQ